MIQKILSHFRPVANVVTLPSTLLHEATHAFVAMPFADEVVLEVYPEVFVGVDYQENAPRRAKHATSVAPFVGGIAMGLLTISWLLTVGETSQSLTTDAMLAFWWAHYTLSGLGDFDVIISRKTQGEDSQNTTAEGPARGETS